MKISMVSEHASPLAALGGVDAGGQNVHVAALSEAVAPRRGLVDWDELGWDLGPPALGKRAGDLAARRAAEQRAEQRQEREQAE